MALTTAVLEPEAPPTDATRTFVPRTLVTGASALIVATGFERGFGFLANLLSARLGGTSTYGAYSLALTTANNIAAYAGAGIGSTATRFSGSYPDGTPGARSLARALALVSLASALIATAVLFAGAGPLARVLLGQPALRGLLQWASLSAGVMILVECCRGFLVGQRRLMLLLIFSAAIGIGMVIVLPGFARRGATAMIAAQACVGTLALAAVFFVARKQRDNVAVDAAAATPPIAGLVGRVWRFGFVQLLGIVGLNAAGWWVASLVTRADQSLFQMGLFAVANQIRNLVALIPGLLTQSSYAMLADEEAGPGRVLLFCTAVAAVMALLVGGGLIVVLPWLLPLAWGKTYAAGTLAGALAIATAIVHMSAAGASARLTILSLRWTGVINAIWSVLVVAGSIVLLTHPADGRAAAIAMALYLVAHTLSAVMVFAALGRFRALPSGFVTMSAVPLGAALALGLLAFLQTTRILGSGASAGIAGLEFLVVLAAVLWLLAAARRHGFSAGDVFGPALAMARRIRGVTA